MTLAKEHYKYCRWSRRLFLFRVLRSSVQTPPLLLLDVVILKSIQPLPHVFWQENPHSSNSTHDGTYDNQEPVQYSLFLA